MNNKFSLSHTMRPLALAAGALLLMLSGCATTVTSPERPEVAAWGVCLEACTAARDTTHALIAYHGATRSLDAATFAREWAALEARRATPVAQLREAILLGNSGADDKLVLALARLERVRDATDPEARALYPLAHLLEAEYTERLQQAKKSASLENQHARAASLLKASERHAQDLQNKLKALTEIEGSLPGRNGARSPSESENKER